MNRICQRAALCVVAGSLLAAGSGCVILPAGEQNYYRGSRVNMTSASTNEIHPGAWTRADVALKFGAPEEVHLNGKVWIYRWVQETVIASPKLDRALLPPKNRALGVLFDVQGVVEKVEFKASGVRVPTLKDFFHGSEAK